MTWNEDVEWDEEYDDLLSHVSRRNDKKHNKQAARKVSRTRSGMLNVHVSVKHILDKMVDDGLLHMRNNVYCTGE